MSKCPKCKQSFYEEEGTCPLDNFLPDTCSCENCGEVYEYKYDQHGDYIIPNFSNSLGNIHKSKKEIWIEEVKALMDTFHESNMNELSSISGDYYLRDVINSSEETATAFEGGFTYEKDVITNQELIEYSQELTAEFIEATKQEEERLQEKMNQALIDSERYGISLSRLL